jgi:asparagine synthase (glutamine-hydrolysing)
MCGIAGFISFDGARNKNWLQEIISRMLDTMQTRGPDDSGTYLSTDGCFALGHTRLSIIDLSTQGKQPMTTMDKSSVISFNGELFNHAHYKKKLNEFSFRSSTDTEILLYLLHKSTNRTCTLQDLNAMFAFAFYDSTKNELLLARDHFGIKPLYYAFTDGGLIFASSPNAIFASGIIKPEFSADLFFHKALTRMESEDQHSWFANIAKLEAGHYLLANLTGIKEHKSYWQPTIADSTTQDTQLLATFKNAVSARSISDVPRAAFLSGGIDSSAIVSAYVDLGIAIKPYIIEYQGNNIKQNEDVAYAQQFAQWKGITPHLTQVTTCSIEVAMHEIVKACHRPFLHGAEFGMYSSYKMLAQQQYKVCYSGHGADEMWGYQDGIYFPILAKSFTPEMHSEYYLTKHYYQNNKPGWHDFLINNFKNTLNVNIPTVENLIWDVTFADYRTLNTIDPVKKARYHLMRRFMNYVNNMVDGISMRFSIEDRPVYQDIHLAELSFSVPETIKNHQGLTDFKPFFKKALQPLLPDNIIYRKKVGFQPPGDDIYKTACLNLIKDYGLPFGLSINHQALAKMEFTQLLFMLTTKIWTNTYF